MTMTFCDPGGDATFGTELWLNTVVGTPVVATDFVHNEHLRSLKFPAGSQNAVRIDGVLAGAGSRVSFWQYINVMPNNASTTRICDIFGGSVIASLHVTSGGILQLWRATATNQIGSDGPTLVTGKWYRIAIAFTIASTSVNEFRVFVDGVLGITVTNATLSSSGPGTLILGGPVSDSTFDPRVSDIYVDDSSALTDPGNVLVTTKRPVANGTTNGFTTQIGSGGSGYGSGHSPQVNERAPSQTNGWSMVVTGSAVTEDYTCEGWGVGDKDISSLIGVGSAGASLGIIGVMGWVYASALTSETAQIKVQGTSTNISLTSTPNYKIKCRTLLNNAGGTATDVGLVTSTTVTTVSLYECGLVVAYIPGAIGKGLMVNQAVQRAATW